MSGSAAAVVVGLLLAGVYTEGDRGTHGDGQERRQEQQDEQQHGDEDELPGQWVKDPVTGEVYFDNGVPLVNGGEGDERRVVPGEAIDVDGDGETDYYAEDQDGDGIEDRMDGDLHGAGGMGGPDGVLDGEEGQDQVEVDEDPGECNVCDNGAPDPGDSSWDTGE